MGDASAGSTLDRGAGILRLAPTWVPRAFCVPGKRLRLHPDDYYALGRDRGGIDERWLASTVHADNGPRTPATEGISHVVGERDALIRFDEAVADLGPALIGDRIWARHGAWPMFAKFFDNQWPLPLHLHPDDEHASKVGKAGKPEAYFYPHQMNDHLGMQPASYLGLDPTTSRAEVRDRLVRFGRAGDNRITELSKAYRTRLGTGWDIPVGVLHAPASLCTYEPQAASDALSMWESWSGGAPVSEQLLWQDVPQEHAGDIDYLLDLLDWEANVAPDFATQRSMTPIPTARTAAETDGPTSERWIAYRSAAFSAKELTIQPGGGDVVRDGAAYGCVVIQGRGELGGHLVESPTMLRYGQLSNDELFVSETRAREGVTITNRSDREPLVILKHFGPANPDLAEIALSTSRPHETPPVRPRSR